MDKTSKKTRMPVKKNYDNERRRRKSRGADNDDDSVDGADAADDEGWEKEANDNDWRPRTGVRERKNWWTNRLYIT